MKVVAVMNEGVRIDGQRSRCTDRGRGRGAGKRSHGSVRYGQPLAYQLDKAVRLKGEADPHPDQVALIRPVLVTLTTILLGPSTVATSLRHSGQRAMVAARARAEVVYWFKLLSLQGVW